MAAALTTPTPPLPVSVDQTADLWLKIDQFHLNYLKSEESTKKIDIRKKLEGFIHQYLCLVPQDRKFCHSSTGDIILQSARWLPDFSAITAARAFEAVEKYAANLINQPWRKEFREIKQYGGFYKHQVQRYLSGCEILFHQMGYVSTNHETLELDGPANQDSVTTVARDCILAFVECQIIATIVQGVATSFPCTWEEALVFRRDHIGTPEQAVRSLVYLKNQMRYQQGLQHSPAIPPGGPYFQPRFPMPAPGMHPGVMPNGVAGQYMPYGYQPQPTGAYYPGIPPVSQAHGYSNGQTNGHPASGSVPTGKLVDVNSHDSSRYPDEGSSGSSGSTVTGRAGPIPLTIKHLEEENKRKSMLMITPEAAMANGGSSLETWDYVFRQLETIGYTKDQAERPDVVEIIRQMSIKRQLELQQQQQLQMQQLQQQQQQQQQHQQQHQIHPQPFQQHPQIAPETPSWSDDPGRTSPEVGATTSEDDTSRKYNSHKTQQLNQRQSHRSRVEDEIDHRQYQPQPQQHQRRGGGASHQRVEDPVPRRRHNNYNGNEEEEEEMMPTSRITKPHQMTRQESSPPPKLPQKKQKQPPELPAKQSVRHWSCRACTYMNRAGVEICEMCAKSRQFGGSESNGGTTTDDYDTTNDDEDAGDESTIACSRCTLRNSRTSRVCDACGASLHISPIRDDEEDEADNSPPPASRNGGGGGGARGRR